MCMLGGPRSMGLSIQERLSLDTMGKGNMSWKGDWNSATGFLANCSVSAMGYF